MKVKIKNEGNNHALPEVILYLDQIPDQFLFHSEYSLRHPFDILNNSLGKVFDTYKRLIDLLLGFYKTAKDVKYRVPDEALYATSDLLLNLNSLYDDCFLILMAVSRPGSLKYKTITDWVTNSKIRSALEFRSDTVIQSKFWKDQINLLKHGNAKLRYITGYFGNLIVPGYYIEGVDKSGSIGPDNSIHEKYLGKATAFSYHYHLRHNMMLVYDVLGKLLKHLRRHFKSSYGHKLSKNRELKLKRQNVHFVLEEITRLPMVFFPDETLKNVSDISLTEKELNIIYPGLGKSLDYPYMMYTFMFVVEKFHRAFYLPYIDEPPKTERGQTIA